MRRRRILPGLILLATAACSLTDDPPVLVPEMVAVPGATNATLGWATVAEPVHKVAAISPFLIGKFEITYALWTNVRYWAEEHGYRFYNTGNAWDIGDPVGQPVTGISHNDALAWCNALSERSGHVPRYRTEPSQTVVYRDSWDSGSTLVKTGTTGSAACLAAGDGYRLPTEAEWEWAARRRADGSLTDGDKPAGYTGTTLTNGTTVIDDWSICAWWDCDSTFAVGRKQPNTLGLFDMSGNVYEFCQDWYGAYTDTPLYTNADPTGAASGLYRSGRGGSWVTAPANAVHLATAFRKYYDPRKTWNDGGFRVVRQLP